MEAAEHANEFIANGLALLGIEADEVDMAVMSAAHAVFWDPIRELLALDTSAVRPERGPDMSRPPEAR